MLDLSWLTYDKKIAINCRSEEEVYEFVSEAKRQYPDACNGWRLNNLQYDRWGENYCLTLYNNRGGHARSLTYYYTDWFIQNGFEVILFSDLSLKDLGEFEPGSLSDLMSL